jgi:hypothetical protein
MVLFCRFEPGFYEKSDRLVKPIHHNRESPRSLSFSFWKLIGLLLLVIGFLIALWLIWVGLRWIIEKIAAAFSQKMISIAHSPIKSALLRSHVGLQKKERKSRQNFKLVASAI